MDGSIMYKIWARMYTAVKDSTVATNKKLAKQNLIILIFK